MAATRAMPCLKPSPVWKPRGRVGHFRAQLNLLEVGGYCLFESGEMARAKQLFEQARPLIQRLGAWRFEPIALLFVAKIIAIQGQYAEAIQLLERAVMVSRETGPSFTGAWALGALAVVTRDAGGATDGLG